MANKNKILPFITCGLGVVSVTFISLFVWKMVAKNEDPQPEPVDVTFTVTFNANGGMLDSGTKGSIKVKSGTKFSEIKNIENQTATKDLNLFYG